MNRIAEAHACSGDKLLFMPWRVCVRDVCAEGKLKAIPHPVVGVWI